MKKILIGILLGIVCSSFAYAAEVKSYDQLVKAIREAHHAAEKRVEVAVEQEKVREMWETGGLIREHILLNQERAEYGKEVLKKLSKDLGVSRTELSYMLQFSRAYPIFPAPEILSWSHYRELLVIKDSEDRSVIAREAEREKWSQKRVRKEIKKRKLKTADPQMDEPVAKLAELRLGKTGQYQIIKMNGKLKVDLGFEVYHDIAPELARGLKANEVIAVKENMFAKNPHPNANDFFIYEALVTEVVDGDTFHAEINLGFDTTITQRVRLRRLDAPEIESAEGKQAKKALEKILKKNGGKVILKVSKTDDQYGRYRVDVFMNNQNIDQELLDTHLFASR